MENETDNEIESGLESLEAAVENEKHVIADEMADALETMLNDWHSKGETWDSELDSQIHEWYVNPPKVFPKKPYFSPSSADSCPREMYEKARGSSKDTGGQAPYQGRWQRIGTAVGDIIQRDILFIEKHVENPPFKFERNAAGQPMFEEFAKMNLPVKYRSHLFYLHGLPDGVLTYVSPTTGEVIRVGLEVKSKQTTYSKTGHYGMKGPDASHKEQCKVYSMMYGLDYYIILYVNASKKGWVMTEEDSAKYPDIRAFGFHITKDEQVEVLGRFADVLDAVAAGTPPLPDLSKWTFNNFKRVIALSLTDEEMAKLEAQVAAMKNSSQKAYTIAGYVNALDDIKTIRAESALGGK